MQTIFVVHRTDYGNPRVLCFVHAVQEAMRQLASSEVSGVAVTTDEYGQSGATHCAKCAGEHPIASTLIRKDSGCRDQTGSGSPEG
jgi:hypothetical protein